MLRAGWYRRNQAKQWTRPTVFVAAIQRIYMHHSRTSKFWQTSSEPAINHLPRESYVKSAVISAWLESPASPINGRCNTAGQQLLLEAIQLRCTSDLKDVSVDPATFPHKLLVSMLLEIIVDKLSLYYESKLSTPKCRALHLHPIEAKLQTLQKPLTVLLQSRNNFRLWIWYTCIVESRNTIRGRNSIAAGRSFGEPSRIVGLKHQTAELNILQFKTSLFHTRRGSVEEYCWRRTRCMVAACREYKNCCLAVL